MPSRPAAFYLYPQDRPPAAGLIDYTAAGVEAGIHQRRLVRENAAPGGRWYRQAREVVVARWALPYNSAYDYGAHDNHVGAVLNGRFVGVDPLDGVDEELLGSAFNSTFVAATRLLERVTTGAEGAYDVGPLGVGEGDAQYLTGKLYDSYARWRGVVEDAEAIMREYRRAMSASGQSRGMSPTALAARRIWDDLAGTTPLLPSAALRSEVEMEEVDVVGNFVLPSQEPLVDPGRFTTVDGKEVDLGSFARVRYAAMLLRIGFAPPLSIPAGQHVAIGVEGYSDAGVS